MSKYVIAIDGSVNALRAVDHVIKLVAVDGQNGSLELHLVNVQPPFRRAVSTHISADQIKQYHQEEGMKELEEARKRLDRAGVKYDYHLFVGDPAEVLTRYAKDNGCHQIVMGTRGMGSVSNMLMGSVATKVIHLTDVPVLLVK